MGNYWLDKDARDKTEQDATLFRNVRLIRYDRADAIGFNLVKDKTESGLKWFARDGGFTIGDVMEILTKLIDRKLATTN
jgi:hypothetical protein